MLFSVHIKVRALSFLRSILYCSSALLLLLSCQVNPRRDDDASLSSVKLGLPDKVKQFGEARAKFLTAGRLEIKSVSGKDCGSPIDAVMLYQGQKILQQTLKMKCTYAIKLSLGEGTEAELSAEKTYFTNITEKEPDGYLLATKEAAHKVTLTLFPTKAGREKGFDSPVQTLSEVEISITVDFGESASPKQKHRVMVIDSGFDTEVDALKGKVVAKYTMDCAAGTSFEDLITQYAPLYAQNAAKLPEIIQQLKDRREESCILKEGFSFEADSYLKSFLPYLTKWNQLLWDGSLGDFRAKPDYDAVVKTLRGEHNDLGHHGTFVSSVIGMKNDNVEFVLVQKQLAKGSDVETYLSRECTLETQNRMNAEVALMNAPGVKEAIRGATDHFSARLALIAKEHRVSFINMSYGPVSWKEFKKLCENSHGYGVNVSEKQAAFVGMSDDLMMQTFRQVFSSDVRPLILQAAGNESSEINDRLDSGRCATEEFPERLLIGSIQTQKSDNGDFVDSRAGSSNYGKCVFVSALGDNIVSQVPLGFYTVGNGTSYSTPMATKLLTQTIGPGLSYADYLDKLRQLADGGTVIPSRKVPAFHVYKRFQANHDNFAAMEEAYYPTDL